MSIHDRVSTGNSGLDQIIDVITSYSIHYTKLYDFYNHADKKCCNGIAFFIYYPYINDVKR